MLGLQPVNDLSAVLHLSEDGMLGPAALGLGHDLLPVVLELFQQDPSILIPYVQLVSYRDLGLFSNIVRYCDPVSACYLYLQGSALIPVRRIG